MKATKLEAKREKEVLTGMIVSDSVCSRISSQWTGDLFRSSWANLIAGWCVKYLNKYDKAPKAQIQNIYEGWAVRQQDETITRMVDSFLSNLSSDYKQSAEEINDEHLIDCAGDYFTQIKLEKITEQIQGDLDTGNLSDAVTRINEWGVVRLGKDDWVDIFQDEKYIKEALTNIDKDVLVKYPGALGKFFGDSLCRDAFISYMGPTKRGKTFWLLDTAFRGALQRRRVAFFEAGDMSKKQITRRFLTRISRWPIKPREIQWPVNISRDPEEKIAIVEHETKKFEVGLSHRRAIKTSKRLQKKRIRSYESYLRVLAHPSDLTIQRIKDICQGWARDGWVPDIIVIDYADLLESDQKGYDKRNQIDDTWRRLRGLSQQYHCLVLTATQSDAASRNAYILDGSHFSESKNKHHHVTGMIGICQTTEEKEGGVMRLNWTDLREEEFIITRCVHVASCPALANMAVKSCW